MYPLLEVRPLPDSRRGFNDTITTKLIKDKSETLKTVLGSTFLPLER